MSAAVLMKIVEPDNALLIDIQEEAERLGAVLVTDGREMRYCLPHHIPPGWTRFALKVKPRLLEPKEPRA